MYTPQESAIFRFRPRTIQISAFDAVFGNKAAIINHMIPDHFSLLLSMRYAANLLRTLVSMRKEIVVDPLHDLRHTGRVYKVIASHL